jgi:hypothetical protein
MPHIGANATPRKATKTVKNVSAELAKNPTMIIAGTDTQKIVHFHDSRDAPGNCRTARLEA